MDEWKVIAQSKGKSAEEKTKPIYPFMLDKRYVEITRDYVNALKETKTKQKRGLKENVLKKEIMEAEKELSQKMRKFYETKKKEYQDERRKIELEYKSKQSTYDNPTEELLKRQEFETSIKVASESKLRSMLSGEYGDLSEHAINMLEIEFKNRDLETPVELTEARSAINVYQNDPEYKKYESHENLLFLIRPEDGSTMMYMSDGINRKTKPINDLRKVTSPHFQEYEITELDTITRGMEGMLSEENNL